MSALAASIERVMGPFRVRPIALVTLVALLAAALATLAITPRIRISDSRHLDLEALVPKAFSGWTMMRTDGLVMPDPDRERLVNKLYNTVLTRIYRDQAGHEIEFLIAYGGDQSDALQLHRPESCYLANGYAVSSPYYEDKIYGGREIRIARVRTRNEQAYEPVSYWMRVGNRLVTTNMDRQLAKLMDGLRGIIPDGVLVRISTRTPSDDVSAEFALQDRFIADLLNSLDPGTLELLLGPQASAKPAVIKS